MTITIRRAGAWTAIAVALSLAGCSAPVPADDNNSTADNAAIEAETGGPQASNAISGDTVGGDGSQIVLSPLLPADIDAAKLAGELGCSFASADGSMLLMTKGNVASKERAQGIVKIADYVEPVGTPGGFDAMVKGATFSGKGTTITIAPTSAAIGGGESPPRAASLTFDRADGARRVFDGRWVCGP